MLSVTHECRYAECHYAECRGAEKAAQVKNKTKNEKRKESGDNFAFSYRFMFPPKECFKKNFFGCCKNAKKLTYSRYFVKLIQNIKFGLK
jgi:hypothetical protein